MSTERYGPARTEPNAETLIQRLRDVAGAYPESVFGPVTEEERKTHSSLVTRASASMGRHFSKLFISAAELVSKQAIELEELRVMQTALAEMVAAFDNHENRDPERHESEAAALATADAALARQPVPVQDHPQPTAPETRIVFDRFIAWAKDNLGRGYSLDIEEGTFVDKVTRWCFKGFTAGALSKQGFSTTGAALDAARESSTSE